MFGWDLKRRNRSSLVDDTVKLASPYPRSFDFPIKRLLASRKGATGAVQKIHRPVRSTRGEEIYEWES